MYRAIIGFAQREPSSFTYIRVDFIQTTSSALIDVLACTSGWARGPKLLTVMILAHACGRIDST
jgi:hypothetical protein